MLRCPIAPGPQRTTTRRGEAQAAGLAEVLIEARYRLLKAAPAATALLPGLADQAAPVPLGSPRGLAHSVKRHADPPFVRDRPLCFPFMIVIVVGVAGCGKTTVGVMLADRLRWTFADADAFHSQANIAKMRSGVPLTDADRRPWLAAIAAWMDERIAAGESAIAGCSALKQSYRDELLAGRPTARLAYLEISREVAHARLVARHGHFFTAALMDSQFAELEPPQETEQVIVLDGTAPPDRLVAEIIERFGLAAGQT